MNYAFKKPYLKFLAGSVDAVGHALRRPPGSVALSPARILVVRLDQLGDIIQTLPFFTSLKKSFPKAEIHFLTTSAGAELFSGQGLVDKFHVWNCRWFDRTRAAEPSFVEWVGRLGAERFDCAFELRGDVRLIALLKMAAARNIVGYGATGGGFLLDVAPEWLADQHAIDKNLRLLEAAGGVVAATTPVLEAERVNPAHPVLAVHPDAGTSAKRWPAENFVRVMTDWHEQRNGSCMLVGLNSQLGEQIAAQLKFPVDNRMGKTNLKELIASLAGCSGLLSNDSGPAHLAAALGKPVWVVWSGTATKSTWAPRGEKVVLFDHPVVCAPCSLAECPVPGHPCVSEISPAVVVKSLVEGL